MKLRFAPVACLVTLLGLGSPALRAAPAESGAPSQAPTASAEKTPVAPATPDKADDKSPQKPAKQPLEKGMAAEKIIELIGNPQQVKPLESKDSKAEMWIYRRQLSTRSVQVPIGEREVPVFSGVGQGNDSIRTTKEIVYGMKQVATFRVTSLLMIDGLLQLAKQTVEESDTY